MPILSVFFGIIVRMWHDDHPPPHIRLEYQGFEALVDVRTGGSSGALTRAGCNHRQGVVSAPSGRIAS